jgi:hypothetical protein
MSKAVQSLPSRFVHLPGKIRLVVIPPLATILIPLSLGLKASNTLTCKGEGSVECSRYAKSHPLTKGVVGSVISFPSLVAANPGIVSTPKCECISTIPFYTIHR